MKGSVQSYRADYWETHRGRVKARRKTRSRLVSSYFHPRFSFQSQPWKVMDRVSLKDSHYHHQMSQPLGTFNSFPLSWWRSERNPCLLSSLETKSNFLKEYLHSNLLPTPTEKSIRKFKIHQNMSLLVQIIKMYFRFQFHFSLAGIAIGALRL